MYEYISGEMVQLAPTYLIIESGGMGYHVQISLTTYAGLSPKPENSRVKIYLHHVVREDAQLLYGFSSTRERDVFRLLISVSGVGAGTARMVLSSLRPEEAEQAILSSNVNLLKSIKGIGLKTAQRIIVDLKDKLGKAGPGSEIFLRESNTIHQESLSALVTLGFPKAIVEKVLDRILAKNDSLSVEELIKMALKEM